MASINGAPDIQDALQKFQASLSSDQQLRLRVLQSVPDAQAVVKFTAQLDAENAKRRSRCVASRLDRFLSSVQQFTGVINSFVSSNPQIAALVWGSVKLTLVVASNFASYFDKLSSFLMEIGRHCPRFSEYQALFPNSTRVQKSLCAFYASVIECCMHALLALQRPGLLQFAKAVWTSFEGEFGQLKQNVVLLSKEVREEINLAPKQSSDSHRKSVRSFMPRAEQALIRIQDNQIQEARYRKFARSTSLLDLLSRYDHSIAFGQAQRKRFGDTSQWIMKTTEFERWIKDTDSSLFWCSGKLGSGKSVLTASIIDHLYICNPPDKPRICFFFCRFDEETSLHSRTFLKSIIRQCLSNAVIPDELADRLESLLKLPVLDEKKLLPFLDKILEQQKSTIIIIDGLDECSRSERTLILKTVGHALRQQSCRVKAYISCRDDMAAELKRFCTIRYHVLINSHNIQSDLDTYIRDYLEEKRANRELVVGSDELLEEIRLALSAKAHGMFLWLAFQVREICAQTSDEAIRQALATLPKDLPTTYNRALQRICNSEREQLTQKIFRWVALAKRPMSIEELREAVSIEPFQQSSKPERLINDIGLIVSSSFGLLIQDEKDLSVQFAHPSVLTFLLEAPGLQFQSFRFKPAEDDRHVGEICVTYLHFSDFQRQLIKIPKNNLHIHPKDILQTSLSSIQNKTASRAWSQIAKIWVGAQRQNVDVIKELRDGTSSTLTTQFRTLQNTHPFLAYASEHWLSHTTNFCEDESRMWSLWTKLVRAEAGFAQVPWTPKEFSKCSSNVLDSILGLDHAPLLRVVNKNDRLFTTAGAEQLLYGAIHKRAIQVFLALINMQSISSLLLRKAFILSALVGEAKMLKSLVAKVDINSQMFCHYAPIEYEQKSDDYCELVEQTLSDTENDAPAGDVKTMRIGRVGAIHLAAAEGHLKILQLLCRLHAAIEVLTSRGQNALHFGVFGGNIEVVDYLLTRNITVDVPGHMIPRYLSPLQLVAKFGRMEILGRLFQYSMVNAEPAYFGGRTALQAAAEGGYLDMVIFLLGAGAYLHAGPADCHGFTALQLAAAAGHRSIVDIFLEEGASVNEPLCEFGGRTALQAAAEKGHVDIVTLLIEKGAEVNAAPAHCDGTTAILAAVEGGHTKVVEALLEAGANTSMPGTSEEGRLVMIAAAKRGQVDLVRRLLDAGGCPNQTELKDRRDYQKWTALDAAIASGHNEVAKAIRGA